MNQFFFAQLFWFLTKNRHFQNAEIPIEIITENLGPHGYLPLTSISRKISNFAKRAETTSVRFPMQKMRFREFQNLLSFCHRLFWKSAKSTSTPTPTNALPFLELKHHTWDLNETILYFEIGAEIALRGVTLRDLFKNGIQTPQNDVKTPKTNFCGGSAPRPPETRGKPRGATNTPQKHT